MYANNLYIRWIKQTGKQALFYFVSVSRQCLENDLALASLRIKLRFPRAVACDGLKNKGNILYALTQILTVLRLMKLPLNTFLRWDRVNFFNCPVLTHVLFCKPAFYLFSHIKLDKTCPFWRGCLMFIYFDYFTIYKLF